MQTIVSIVLGFFVQVEMYDTVDEEGELLKIELEDAEVRVLHVRWLSWFIPNDPGTAREVLEDAALHILLVGNDKKVDPNSENLRNLATLLGKNGAKVYAEAVLRRAKEEGGKGVGKREVPLVGGNGSENALL